MTYQPLTNLTFNGFYEPNYMTRGGVSFTSPSVFSINSNITLYRPNEIRNPLEQMHSVSFAFSSPVRIWGKNLGLRCNVTHDKYPLSSNLGAYYGFNSTISQFYINYIGQYKVSRNEGYQPIKTVTSQVILGSRRTRLVRPQCRIDYNHNINEVTKYGIFLSRRVFKTGQLSVSYERDRKTRSGLYMITFNIFTNFADFNSRVIASPDQVAMTQSQHGSIRYDQELGAVHFNRRSGIGQCSAILRPFVDDNFNGRYDEGEDQIPGVRAKIKGAQSDIKGTQDFYFYDRLQPYNEYLVEIDEYSLDNPLLKPVHDGYRMYFNPNMVTAIEVPVVTVSEVSGVVERQMEHGRVGMGGVVIELLNMTNGSRNEIITFNNGEFYYLGLIPGKYRARVLAEQLETYGYATEPNVINFDVAAVAGGTSIENVNFLLVPQK